MLEDKIQAEICNAIAPLFDIWKEDAKWTDAESLVFYHKVFDAEKPDEQTIQYILADKISKEFLYYNKRKINRLYKSAQKKLNKIL